MARPTGRVQTRPTKAAIRSYYEMLKAAASKGDINAAGKLIELHHMDNQRESRNGTPAG